MFNVYIFIASVFGHRLNHIPSTAHIICSNGVNYTIKCKNHTWFQTTKTFQMGKCFVLNISSNEYFVQKQISFSDSITNIQFTLNFKSLLSFSSWTCENLAI